MKDINLFMLGMAPEFVEKANNLIANGQEVPWGAIESMVGRAAAMAVTKNQQTDPRAVVLPDNIRFKTFADGFNKLLPKVGLPTIPIYWAPDFSQTFSLEEAIQSGSSGFFSQLPTELAYRVHPQRHSQMFEGFLATARQYGLTITSALPYYDFSTDNNPLNRSGWGRDLSRLADPSFPEKYGIPYPQSYIARNSQQVLEAVDRLQNEGGSEKVFMKRIHSASGEVYPATTRQALAESYDMLIATGRIKMFGKPEPVEIQAAVDLISGPSFQIDNGRRITPGGYTEQIFNGTQWIGNKWNAGIDGVSRDELAIIKTEIDDIAANLERGLVAELGSLVGRGGADLAIYRDSQGQKRTAVMELNGGRYTGADPGNFLAETLEVQGQSFLSTKVLGVPQSSLAELTELLESRHLLYDPYQKTGVFPILWLTQTSGLKSSGCGSLFISQPDQVQLSQSYLNIVDILDKEGHTIEKPH